MTSPLDDDVQSFQYSQIITSNSTNYLALFTTAASTTLQEILGAHPISRYSSKQPALQQVNVCGTRTQGLRQGHAE